MTERCPQCGAELQPGESCRDRFELLLSFEYEKPTSYGAAHHLMVACYMLQHNEYTREGWLGTRELVRRFVREGLTPAAARKQNRQKLSSGQRKWSVTRGEKIPRFESICWTRTIADIRLDNPQAYGEDVKQWAESVLADTEQFVQELKAGT